mgnify:CR=1 FL=1
MFKGLKPIQYGGREVWPLVEGGKGVAVSNHMSSGAWAAAGGIGTVSAVNADSYDALGNPIPQIYHGRTRRDRHEELVAYAIEGAVEAVRAAGGGGDVEMEGERLASSPGVSVSIASACRPASSSSLRAA